jgi:hypothetical protein
MKNLLFLSILLLFAGTISAQRKNRTPHDLFGYHVGKTEATVIDFKGRHNCEIKTIEGNTVTKSQKATWKKSENGNLIFLDDNGKFLFELENQKDNWYERDKQRDYTFKMIYVSVKDVNKPRKGQGC